MDPILLSLFTFFAGLLIGHRLTLGREKRKEFNEVAQRVRSVLLSECERPSPYSKFISRDDMDLFIQVLPPLKRRGFNRALERYYQAIREAQSRGVTGEVLYTNTDAIKEAAQDLVTYTKRK